MTRETSIYTLPTGGALYARGPLSPLMLHTDEGPEMVVGYVVVNTIPAGVGGDYERMVIEAAPGVPPLDGMTVAVSGLDGPWDDEVEAARWVESIPYLRRCAYIDGAGERVDCWEYEVPAGAVVVEGPTPAHGWR
jgi:hypothetical protein